MDEYEVSLKDYIDVIRKEKLLIISIFLVAVVAAGIFSSAQPKEYETRTTLLITPRITEELTDIGGDAALFSSSFSTGTYEKLAVTNDLLMNIIESLDLRSDGKRLTVASLRKRMVPKVEFASSGKTRSPLPLLTMTVKGSDPEEIKNIAEIWGKLFIEKNTELLSTRTAQSYEFIQDRYNEVNIELKDKEEEKIAYQKENPLSSLSTEYNVSKSTYNKQLSLLQDKRLELEERKTRLVNLKKVLGGKQISRIDNPVLTQIALEHQVYLSMDDYLTDTRVAVSSLGGEISYLEEETGKLKKELDTMEARINEINIHLSSLNRDIDASKDTYNFLSGKLQEARIAKEEQLGSIRIVEAPIVPQVPSGPSKMLNVIIAGILGLFVGVFAAFFKNYMESS